MKPIEFFPMKRKGDSMTLSVNDDLHDDLAEDDEASTLVIFDDLVDFEIERRWILIFEICYDEYLEDDLVEEVVKLEGERI
jgi:hypothetical protein